jgi:hypothetical protein
VECGRFEEISLDSSLLAFACLEAKPLAVKGSLLLYLRGASCEIFQSGSSSKSFLVSMATVRGLRFLILCGFGCEPSGSALPSETSGLASSEGSFLMKMPACRAGFLLTRMELFLAAVGTSSLNSRTPTNSLRTEPSLCEPRLPIAGASPVAGSYEQLLWKKYVSRANPSDRTSPWNSRSFWRTKALTRSTLFFHSSGRATATKAHRGVNTRRK